MLGSHDDVNNFTYLKLLIVIFRGYVFLLTPIFSRLLPKARSKNK